MLVKLNNNVAVDKTQVVGIYSEQRRSSYTGGLVTHTILRMKTGDTLTVDEHPLTVMKALGIE